MNEKNLTITDNDVGRYLETMKQSLSKYAVKNYNQDSFFKSAMLAIVENDNLRACLTTPQGKASLFNALRYAATTGLSLNPQEGKACLIAYGGKVQYQVMKNGLLSLAMDSGQVSLIQAEAVRINDEFKLTKTSDGDSYFFSPALRDRGDFLGFFASVKFKNGNKCVCWMTKKEIEDHRDTYSAMFKSKPEVSPWKKSFEGMAIKTVLTKLIRNLIISDDLDRVIGTDDMFEGETINVSKNGYSAEDITKEIQEKMAEPPSEPEEKKPEPKEKKIENKPLF